MLLISYIALTLILLYYSTCKILYIYLFIPLLFTSLFPFTIYKRLSVQLFMQLIHSLWWGSHSYRETLHTYSIELDSKS